MSRIVIKYGGSNLRNPQGVMKLAEVLQRYRDPLVVVSALYGVTDQIDSFLQRKRITRSDSREFTALLKSMHGDLVVSLIQDAPDRMPVLRKLKDATGKMEHALAGIHGRSDVSPELRSLLLSYGERLSALAITGILNHQGRSCDAVFPEQLGLIARGDLANASIDLKRSEKKVKKVLAGKGITVVPGFYGITSEGNVGLLGRGGSDYSAACIAHCLDAHSLDVWKDVRGFLSSDPDIVTDVVRQESLTYDEAAELAYFGARILHPRTMEPLVEKKIPIRLFSTNEETPHPLSVINGRSLVSDTVIKSISYTDELSVLKLSGAGVGIKPGVLARVTTILDDHGINISSVITSQIAINLIIGKGQADEACRLVRSLDMPVIKEVNVLGDISLLALVGHGMVEQHGVASRTFSVLAAHGINVHLSSMGASDVTTYLVIDRKHKERALHEIHREFFGPAREKGLRKAG